MWELSNRTPYAVDRTWVQDERGARHWVVVVKGTFAIGANGTLSLADEQVPPTLAPEYNGEDGVSSLKYEADLGPAKPGTDVYVVGHARAPGGRPVTRVSVGLRIGSREKVLEVLGDRTYERDVVGVVPSSPLPFVELPLVYERAFGGFDDESPDPAKQALFAANPVGMGFVATRRKLVGLPVPNIGVPGVPPGSKGAAGLGAITSHWAPRCEHAGTYDAKWVKERKPLLPLDFDPRFHLCAPVDQQFVPHLRGGERIELVGMTASGALGFEVPRVALGFLTRFQTRKEPVHHRASLVTVIVEPDHPRVCVVWHTSIPCNHAEMEYLEETVIREKRFVAPAGSGR